MPKTSGLRLIGLYKKAFWTVIKYLVSHHCFKKTNLLLFICFSGKVELFSSSFVRKITIIKNDIKLPHKFLPLPERTIFQALFFTVDDIAKIINNLEPEKTHEHDMISIRMLKLCRTLFLNHWNGFFSLV